MIIELENITKNYPGCPFPAVKNINFAVKPREIVTLLGPSGCGKTTLLRLISGLEKPDNGKIILNGKTVTSNNNWIPPEKRGVAMVFQDYALFPHLNVKQNIAFGLDNKKEKLQKKIKEMLDLVGLSLQAEKNPADLSGGQQQRVALARALIRDPLLVMLDEPFNNLDMNLRDQMQREIVKIIRKTEATAIFVTHNQKEALSISDKIIVMNQGQIEQKGTPRQIYELPETKFVASFVGQSNIMQGKIGKEGNTVITDIGNLPCNHTHGKKPGEKVNISVRSESFEYDPEGAIEGIIQETYYKGETIDALISVSSLEKDRNLNVHIHPEVRVKKGDKMNFRVLPHFVAVIN